MIVRRCLLPSPRLAPRIDQLAERSVGVVARAVHAVVRVWTSLCCVSQRSATAFERNTFSTRIDGSFGWRQRACHLVVPSARLPRFLTYSGTSSSW